MSKRLQGRVALVTGAGNGIGRAIAFQMASEGASVVVNDLGTSVEGEGRDTSAADDTVRHIIEADGSAVASYDSIAEPEGCISVVEMAVDHFGSCDIIVANAGALTKAGKLGINSDDESWHQLLNPYLRQKFWLTREALPGMLERGWGRVIFASSEIARSTQHTPLGAVVLSGGIGLMHDLAYTHANSGVTFNCYAPEAATFTFDLYKNQIEKAMMASGMSKEDIAKRILSVSPGKRFEVRVEVWEARNSLWVSSPSIWDTKRECCLLLFSDKSWSADTCEWLDEVRVRLVLRKFPGNHSPPSLTVDIDCVKFRANMVANTGEFVLEELEHHLNKELSFKS